MFHGKEIFSTLLRDFVIPPAVINAEGLSPCPQEEADTDIFLHVSAATRVGHRQVILLTNDSDVVVLTVTNFLALGDRVTEL